MLRFRLLAISVGIWLGALAGVATALSDFGAHWLFMESWGDRGWLLLRLLSTQPPVGGALGAAVGMWIALCAPAAAGWAIRIAGSGPHYVRAQRGVYALICTSLLLPGVLAVARLLFTGGHMARVAGRELLQPTAALLLTAALLVMLYGAQWLFTNARHAEPRSARHLLAVLAAVGFATAKLNQLTLPNLYDYLHAVLSTLAAGAWALAAAVILARALDRGRFPPAARMSGLGLGALLGLGGYATLTTLDQNQNVRVALLNSNMPHSRALFMGIAPLLPKIDARSAELSRLRAARARIRRAQHGPAAELPALEGAHVLLITVDALRADHLGSYGYKRHVSDELDALASRAVVFEHAYAQAPHSSYSLCSLMTSEYLHETLELGQLPPTATLPRVLSAVGYHTAAFYTQGIFHTAGEKLSNYEDDAFGFALHEHQDRPAEEMTDRVLQEVDRTRARGEPSSLFWVHYFDVHEPYEATTLGHSDMDRYDSELLATDRAIGRLVRETQRRLKKDVVVLITADHGEEFHEHGGVYHGSSLYEEQVHVPLLLLATGMMPVRVATPVESIDIAPTLLGIVGVDVPTSMRGADLRSLAFGRSSDRGPVFSAVIHKKMVVRWPYKLIADLRFGLFELYDLQADPRERDNLADRDPALLSTLRGEVYAWTESLTPADQPQLREPSLLALEWGRLGDRRAVQPLCRLALDENANTAQRAEAARLLGKLADDSAADGLLAATHAANRWVAAEAAIALGRLFDARAAPLLRKLVVAEDPGIRSRAGISLGRLRDQRAVPALIDALWVAPSGYEREEAVRWLGRLRDSRALDPLIDMLADAHTRHLVVLALGELGDARAFAPLSQVLSLDRNVNVRDGVVRGLGALGDARGIDLILRLAGDDPGLRNTGESLVRLHAIERRAIGGADLTQGHAASDGFGACYVGPLRHDWDYLHRTSCTTAQPLVSLRLSVPPRVRAASFGATALLSIKRLDAVQPAEVTVSIGGQTLSPVRIDGAWAEYRWPVAAPLLVGESVEAQLRTTQPEARFEVDHLLLLPRAVSQPLAARSP
ncbi:MAG TPA: sulfatase-like hydrolase/transferase [Polyangiales bacterium]